MNETVFGVRNLDQFLPLAVLTVACLAAGWLDFRYRRIPNWLCALTAIAGLLVAAFAGAEQGGILSHGLHMIIALLGGMVLFRFGVFGGGDAKFYAAVAAWFPLAGAVSLLVMVTLCGLVLLIVWFTYRRLRGYPISKKSGSAFDGLPYGIAIGAGALTSMLA